MRYEAWGRSLSRSLGWFWRVYESILRFSSSQQSPRRTTTNSALSERSASTPTIPSGPPTKKPAAAAVTSVRRQLLGSQRRRRPTEVQVSPGARLLQLERSWGSDPDREGWVRRPYRGSQWPELGPVTRGTYRIVEQSNVRVLQPLTLLD